MYLSTEILASFDIVQLHKRLLFPDYSPLFIRWHIEIIVLLLFSLALPKICILFKYWQLPLYSPCLLFFFTFSFFLLENTINSIIDKISVFKALEFRITHLRVTQLFVLNYPITLKSRWCYDYFCFFITASVLTCRLNSSEIQ